MSIQATRENWGNQLQFLLTSIGYSVGLGNLWRFPGVAYQNGGGAFLIPYLICSVFIGLPMLYLEFFIGQFVQAGAGKAFRFYMPALQGIGWTSILCVFFIGIYYNVIIVYCLLYLLDVVMGKSSTWTSCSNDWNSVDCLEINGTHNGSLPAEEYYAHKLLNMSSSIGERGEVNIPILLGLVVMWIITYLCLVKGVKYIGYISYVTSTLPYIIVAVFFVRGITLPGCMIGLKFYLFEPDFGKLFNLTTWTAAANQLCFSLSTGFGALLSLASYNDRKHNCFKDAVIVVCCDSFMSVFGGAAVFAILGFLSHQSGKPIDHLIQSKGGIAFVAYPEAISQMTWSPLWNFLIFFMFFLLGISSQFGCTQAAVTALIDQFPSLKRYSSIVLIFCCIFCFAVGLTMCWQDGIYWLDLFNNSVGANTVLLMCLAEVLLVVHVYGITNLITDIKTQLGSDDSIFGRIFGKSGYFMTICWILITPIMLIALITVTFIDQITSASEHPLWTIVVGFIIQYIPLLLIPLIAIFNVLYFYKYKKNWKLAFKVQPELPSYGRINNNKVSDCNMESSKEMEVTEKKSEETEEDLNDSIC